MKLKDLNVELHEIVDNHGAVLYVGIINRYKTSRAGLVEAVAILWDNDAESGGYIPIPVFTDWWTQ